MSELPIIESCDDCGACCEHMRFPPFIKGERIELELIDDLAKELDLSILLGDVEDRPCVWLHPDTKRCINYEHRPHVCRDFDLGGPDCIAAIVGMKTRKIEAGDH